MANSGVVAASDVADGSPNLSPEAVSWSLLVGRMPRLPSPGPPRFGGGDASRPRDRSKPPEWELKGGRFTLSMCRVFVLLQKDADHIRTRKGASFHMHAS